MEKVFLLNSEIQNVEELISEKDATSVGIKITGYASTTSKDRAGDVIVPDAWNKGGLQNFTKNPILLFNHKYDQPIGKVTDVTVDDNGLKIKGVISKEAGNVYGLVKEGVLSTFSVGFLVKDAEYDKVAEGLIIKDAELLEVSVVSVPCNQDATFSVSKAFDNQEEFLEFRKQFEDDSSDIGVSAPQKEQIMDELNEEKIATIVQNALKASEEKRLEAEKKAAEEKAIREKQDAVVAETVTKVLATESEKIYSELEKRFADDKTSLEEKISGLETILAEKSEELTAIANSKRKFVDRGNTGIDAWKKDFAKEVEDAYLLGRVTEQGYETKFAKNLLEKVNAHSGVEVSSADFEQEVSTNIQRDIELELILKPMFREISMNAATMILPIMPDVGYAEITAASGTTTGVAPHGTLDERGGSDRGGADLTEITLQTSKMVAKTYLGNETEEDAIMPILPLLRDSMVRQHARGVENLILLAGHADGEYSGLTTSQGLLKYASTQSRSTTNSGTVGTLPALTGAALLVLRKNMGKYGINPRDVVYIVSLRGYFELLEDPEFQDFNLVGNQATKLNGEVGQIFGSKVMICDEFPAAAADKFYACAVNTRNFLIPRLRGITVESDYSVEDQHRVLVTTQRLGFKEIIPNAKSVFGLAYPAAS